MITRFVSMKKTYAIGWSRMLNVRFVMRDLVPEDHSDDDQVMNRKYGLDSITDPTGNHRSWISQHDSLVSLTGLRNVSKGRMCHIINASESKYQDIPVG